MEGLQLKRALLIAALAIVRCPMELAEKDKALSPAIELLSNDDEAWGVEDDFPQTGLKPFDLAVSNYLEGNTQPL
jgi:hypothetical protein